MSLACLFSLQSVHLSFMNCATLCLLIWFCLSSVTLDTEILIPTFFLFTFAWYIFVHIFTFTFSKFLRCRCVSYIHRQSWIFLCPSSSKSFPFVDKLSQFTCI